MFEILIKNTKTSLPFNSNISMIGVGSGLLYFSVREANKDGIKIFDEAYVGVLNRESQVSYTRTDIATILMGV